MRLTLGLGVFCAASAVVGACSETPTEPVGAQVSRIDLTTAEVGAGFATDAPSPMLAHLGHSPAIAFDGEQYAVVFEDGGKVRAVRVGADGTVLDLNWLDFGEVGKTQLYPSVAYGAGKFLVVYTESEGDGPLSVRARLFDGEGTIEGDASATVSAGEALYPSVAFDGQGFVVAFLDLAGMGENDVHIARVSASGSLIPNSERPVTSNGFGGRPVIARGTTRTLVAWEDRTNDVYAIRAARIDTAGDVLDAGGVRLSTETGGEYEPAVAALGDDFLVAFRSNSSPYAVRGSIFSGDGEITASNIALSRSSTGAGLPSVSADGNAFLVAWADERDERSIYGTRVSPSGALLDVADVKLATAAPRSVSSGDQTALAAGAEQFLVAFIGDGVQGSLLDADLEIADGNIALSAVANAQSAQQVLWNGQSYVITWVDERTREVDSFDARFVRIAADGERLDERAVVLSEPGAFSLSQASSAEGAWLAAWTSIPDGTVYSRAVATDGTPGTLRELTERQVSMAPALASNGSGYLSMYTAFESGGTYDVYARELGAEGELGDEYPIVQGLTQPASLTLAAHGESYLVSLHEQNAVRLIAVDADATVGSPLSLATSRGLSAIASNGEQALIALIDDGGAVSARLYEDGALSGSPISIAETSSGFMPAVAWDGDSFVVAWDEDETRELKARTVSSTGVAGVTRTLVQEECLGPVLASNGEGQLLVTCVRFAESAVTRRLVSYFIDDVATLVAPPAGSGGRPSQGTGGAVSTAGRAGGSSEEAGNEAGGASDGGSTSAGGRAGSPSTGGALSTGGSTSSVAGRSSTAGGQNGAGGTSTSPTSGAGGQPVALPPSSADGSDDGGCSVALAPAQGLSRFALALSGLALLALRRRRR